MAERATANQATFNGGEASPRLAGRTDLARYFTSCETMLGWLPLVQGGAVAAPGTHYIDDAAGPCRLIAFEPYVTQGYVIELSAGTARFYTNDVRIDPSPGIPYELATPWTYDDVLKLDYQESIDVLYVVGAGKPAQKLTRTGAETFTLAPLDLRRGPIGDGNIDETLTVAASGTTGTISLASLSPVFVATDVGSLFEIEAADFNDVPSWEPGLTVTAGEKRTWAGKVYQAIFGGGGRTGSVPPEHDSGAEWDGSATGTDINDKGPYGVKWQFLHGRYGLVRITAFTDAMTVTAEVIDRLADSLTFTSSWRWSFGAFSDTRGWPDAVCVWNESLVLFRGAEAFISVVGDLENFGARDSSGDFQRDLAGRFTLPNRDAICWCAADRVLVMGATKGEYAVERILTNNAAAGPPVFDVKLQATNGSAVTKPIQADGRMLFVQRVGRKLLELAYAISEDRYLASNSLRFADHIGAPGFVDLAWQQEPERHVWAVMGDGTLATMCYAPADEVIGWARRELGGGMMARSICRITDPDGKRDQMWIAVETPEGDHRILRMHKSWETGDDPVEAVMVDAALTYRGAPVDQISGLDHLEGQTVQVLADGMPHADRIVAGGAIALDFDASVIHVGLGFPARIRTLRIELGQSEGTAQGKIKRMVALTLLVLDAGGLDVKIQDGEQLPIEGRLPGNPFNQPTPLLTGQIVLDTVGCYERGGQVTIERTQPTPATLLALIPAVETGEI